MEMIKSDLDKLGIKHDSLYLRKIVKTNKLMIINQLKNKYVEEYMNHQKVE